MAKNDKKLVVGTNRIVMQKIHPDDRADLGKPSMKRRRVAVNLRESGLDWLRHRKLLSERQHAAGERLRQDYERAGLGARVTMRWDAAPSVSGRRGGAAPFYASDAAVSAKDRFHAALRAAGPGLSDICWRVVCANEGLSAAEKAMGWPTRSGRLVLTLALDRLAGFYGL